MLAVCTLRSVYMRLMVFQFYLYLPLKNRGLVAMRSDEGPTTYSDSYNNTYFYYTPIFVLLIYIIHIPTLA